MNWMGYRAKTYQWDTLTVDLSVTTLVDQLADGLQVGLSVSDPGLNNAEHLLSSLRQLDEDTVVDLEETEKLEDLAGLGGDLVDTIGMSAKSYGTGCGVCVAYPLMRTTKTTLASAGT
jgi:hypothetical protein